MTQDGMWQDSGRYEWPLTGAPLSTASVPFVQTQTGQAPDMVVSIAADRDMALIMNPYDNWYTPQPAGPGVSSAGIVLTARPDLESAEQEIAALKAENCDLLIAHAELTRRLNELRARVAELERARDGRTL